MKPFSIYLHIPFCHHKCPYCDFNTYAVAHVPEGGYTSALLAELDFRASLPEWAGRTVQSIYFGGGTPSLFSPKSIRKILGAISQIFPVDEQAEISLEANPGTVGTDTLTGYREAGVNRISFGVQSFTNETLKVLGRIHTPEQCDAAMEAARSSGFHNISLDLIFGVPGQSLQDLDHDINHAISLGITHLSAYGLTIEEGTPFYQSFKRGTLKLPSDDIVSQMMESLQFELPRNGFHRYEISNYAKSGREARHNLAYWNGDDYMGLGAGAHSFLGFAPPHGAIHGKRWSNFALPKKYMEDAVATGSAESWSESLDRNDSMFEYFFLGLRKTSGVSLSLFHSRFGVTIQTQYPELITILESEGLVSLSDDHLALTERGLLLADSVIENFAANYHEAKTALHRVSGLPSQPAMFHRGGA